MVTRIELHRMVDELTEAEVESAARIIARLREDPLRALLETIPEDDESVTEEDVEAIRRGRADYAAGRHASLEDVKRELAIE